MHACIASLLTAATDPPPPFCRAFPSGRAVWRQLTQPIQLQEACFQDVVLLYRPAGAAAAAAQAAAAAGHRRGRVGCGKGGSSAGARGGQQEELPSVDESVGGASDEVGSCMQRVCWKGASIQSSMHRLGSIQARSASKALAHNLLRGS